MGCPHCRSDEIDPSGVCLVCGYQISANTQHPVPEPGEMESPGFSGMIEMDYAGETHEHPPEDELPQWRKELSQRFQAIRRKKDASGVPVAESEGKAPLPSAQKEMAAMPPIPVAPKPAEMPPVRKSAPKSQPPAPRQKMLQPLEPESPVAKSDSKKPALHEIQKLIDTVVSRKSTTANITEPPAEFAGYGQDSDAENEGKLILVSRTLSGLVDMIFVVLCTGGFIIAADFFSGIIVLDSISLLLFSALFLFTYFVYSMFFLSLSASNQTVGMMITDLRVIGADEKRPSPRRLLSRCCWHLLSLFGLGIGLLWSLFNRENLCLHDRYSNTRVIRI
jgi:uncharacterized RDD family membrane protein YckC